MDIKFSISKPGNIFHVIDSISGWSPHTRDHIKKWYESLFGLSVLDDPFIDKYKQIRIRTDWEKFDSAFILSKNLKQAFARAQKLLKPHELKGLEDVFEHFSENATIMYEDSRPKLVQRKKYLEEEIHKYDLQGMCAEAQKFFDTRKVPEKVHVHLLLNTCNNYCCGGANTDSDTEITLEPVYLGKSEKGYFARDLGVIAHEAIHSIQNAANPEKMEQYLKLVKSIGINNIEQDIIREAIMDTLVPHGVLAVMYGLESKAAAEGIIPIDKATKITPREENERDYIQEFRKKLAAHLYEATQKAIESGSSIFENNYLENAVDTLISLRPKPNLSYTSDKSLAP